MKQLESLHIADRLEMSLGVQNQLYGAISPSSSPSSISLVPWCSVFVLLPENWDFVYPLLLCTSQVCSPELVVGRQRGKESKLGFVPLS